MARTRTSFDATLLMQIAVVLFLITLGIVGIMYYNSRLGEWGRSIDRFFGRPSNPVNIIVAVAELVAGIIIGFALFVPGYRQGSVDLGSCHGDRLDREDSLDLFSQRNFRSELHHLAERAEPSP